MDKFRAMQVFVEVVRQGGFTAASEILGLTPQMIGQHVRALEAELGAQLLNRTTRKVSVTELGTRWFDHCEAILQQQIDAESYIRHVQEDAQGLLCITAPTTFGSEVIAPTLPLFRALNPKITIDLNLSNQRSDIVGDGFELAVRIGALPDSDLIARPLGQYRTILAASPDYLAQHGIPETPEDLASHACLSFGLRRERRNWKLVHGEAHHHVKVSEWLRCDNGTALKIAAVAGAGVVAQPEILLRDEIRRGRLTHVLPEYEVSSKPVNLVFVQSRFMTPKLRSIIDFSVQNWRL